MSTLSKLCRDKAEADGFANLVKVRKVLKTVCVPFEEAEHFREFGYNK